MILKQHEVYFGAEHDGFMLQKKWEANITKLNQRFVLMDNNARSHRTILVNTYIEKQGFERTDHPARFKDISPSQRICDYLGEQLSAQRSHPATTHEFEESFAPDVAFSSHLGGRQINSKCRKSTF
ncbi:hypothetical protein AVEN_224850-1 [Araneus ventricosus]|uniref:Tc1-like transposase DDE domain-containing protein n=1 Tax=Araneus ventricosus TaxID=182803 RepID=A0A4Y2TC63_ARAVE|nr:hypothetical protein AVEN_3984-1 [Araneus ventricosus]GBN97598.1 hypothetical protein AVEN_224850-1 [Araneus ventricosus]